MLPEAAAVERVLLLTKKYDEKMNIAMCTVSLRISSINFTITPLTCWFLFVLEDNQHYPCLTVFIMGEAVSLDFLGRASIRSCLEYDPTSL